MTTKLTFSRYGRSACIAIWVLWLLFQASISRTAFGEEFDQAELRRMVREKDYPKLTDSPEDRELAKSLLKVLGGHVDSIGNIYLTQYFSDADIPIILPFQDSRGILMGTTQLGDDGMRELRKMKSLQYFSQLPAGVTDDGIAHLRGLPILNLALPPQATDKCMETITTLRELNGVQLSAQITNEGFRHLAKLPQLIGISLHDSQVSNLAFEQIGELQKLGYIDFGTAPRITPEVTKQLQQFPNLQWLVGPRGTNDRTLELLAPVKSLTFLDLSSYDGVTDEGMKHMPSFERLHQLKLGANITDAGIAHLGKLEHLRYLDLVKTKVTGKGLAFLGPIGPSELRISDSVSDEGLASITDFSRLSFLVLHGNFTDACLPHLPGRLDSVEFRGTNVSKDGIRKLHRERPTLQIYFNNADGIPLSLDE